jgi:hypothetical protein
MTVSLSWRMKMRSCKRNGRRSIRNQCLATFMLTVWIWFFSILLALWKYRIILCFFVGIGSIFLFFVNLRKESGIFDKEVKKISPQFAARGIFTAADYWNRKTGYEKSLISTDSGSDWKPETVCSARGYWAHSAYFGVTFSSVLRHISAIGYFVLYSSIRK